MQRRPGAKGGDNCTLGRTCGLPALIIIPIHFLPNYLTTRQTTTELSTF
jgi:hypothetical protein